MKRALSFILAVLFTLMLVFSMASCQKSETLSNDTSASPMTSDGGGAQTSAEVSAEPVAAADYIGKTLTIALDCEPDSLLIQSTAPNAGASHVTRCLYNWLFERDEQGNYVSSIAKEVEWIDDTHLRISINEDAHFSDGSPITAEDIIYSWTLGLEGTAFNSYSSPWAPDEHYAEDDYTAVLAFDRPYPYVTDSLDDLTFAVINKDAVEALGGMLPATTNPVDVGSGRYTFVEWMPGQHILVKYNENYWDSSYVPSYEYINFTFVSDAASRCLSVKSGEADVAISISLADTFAYTDDDDVIIDMFSTAATGGVVLWYLATEGPFSDENVRLALNYLVDWKACAKLLTGSEDTSMQGWFNSGSPYYNGPDQRVYDPEKGLEILAQSGYPDGFKFDLKIEPTDGYETVAQRIQADLLKANIEANLINVEFASWFSMFADTDYEVYLGGAASTPLQFALGYFDARPTAEMKLGGPRVITDEMTAALDIATTTFDENERKEAIMDLQKYIIEHALCQGVTTNVRYTLSNKSVTNLATDSAGWLLPYFVQAAQ